MCVIVNIDLIDNLINLKIAHLSIHKIACNCFYNIQNYLKIVKQNHVAYKNLRINPIVR